MRKSHHYDACRLLDSCLDRKAKQQEAKKSAKRETAIETQSSGRLGHRRWVPETGQRGA